MLGLLSERAAIARELAGVERQLERSGGREDKVEILIRAMDELQARRGNPVLQLSSGTGGGDSMMHDHHILNMVVAVMNSEAPQCTGGAPEGRCSVLHTCWPPPPRSHPPPPAAAGPHCSGAPC